MSLGQRSTGPFAPRHIARRTRFSTWRVTAEPVRAVSVITVLGAAARRSVLALQRAGATTVNTSLTVVFHPVEAPDAFARDTQAILAVSVAFTNLPILTRVAARTAAINIGLVAVLLGVGATHALALLIAGFSRRAVGVYGTRYARLCSVAEGDPVCAGLAGSRGSLHRIAICTIPVSTDGKGDRDVCRIGRQLYRSGTIADRRHAVTQLICG
jgi:hypothetical protein